MTAKLLQESLARLPVADHRNRFFTGKFLSARDLSDEQAYFLERRRLHNLLHGWGIVAGFDVDVDRSNGLSITVGPGFALDPLGRELILREARSFTLPATRTPCFIVVHHEEYGSEPVPVLVPNEADTASQRDDNRIVETVAIIAVDPIEISARQWLGKTDGHGSAGSRDAVPIAFITDSDVDQSGCRMLGDSAFTRIVEVNWMHNGKSKAAAIKKDGLQITFSGPIDHGTVSADILECRLQDGSGSTVVTQCAAEAKLLPKTDGETDNRVRFELHASTQKAMRKGCKVFLQLHCDFLLDQGGNAVDGNFLGGRLPTGNGRPGGSFISWFELD
jgi:hypothetical protein